MYFVLVKMKRTNKYWKPWMFVYFAVLTYLFRYSILDSKFASVFFRETREMRISVVFVLNFKDLSQRLSWYLCGPLVMVCS